MLSFVHCWLSNPRTPLRAMPGRGNGRERVLRSYTEKRPSAHQSGKRGSRFRMKMEVSRQYFALGARVGEVLSADRLRVSKLECRNTSLDVWENGFRQLDDPGQNTDLPLCTLNVRREEGNHRHLGCASPARVHLPDQVERRINCQSVVVHLVSFITVHLSREERVTVWGAGVRNVRLIRHTQDGLSAEE